MGALAVFNAQNILSQRCFAPPWHLPSIVSTKRSDPVFLETEECTDTYNTDNLVYVDCST